MSKGCGMCDAQSARCARLNAIRRTCWHELTCRRISRHVAARAVSASASRAMTGWVRPSSVMRRKRDAFDVDVRIRKDARHVIERRETDAGLSTDEQGVVLAVSVRAGDHPVVRSCLKCAQIRVLPDRGASIT